MCEGTVEENSGRQETLSKRGWFMGALYFHGSKANKYHTNVAVTNMVQTPSANFEPGSLEVENSSSPSMYHVFESIIQSTSALFCEVAYLTTNLQPHLF